MATGAGFNALDVAKLAIIGHATIFVAALDLSAVLSNAGRVVVYESQWLVVDWLGDSVYILGAAIGW